MHCLVNITTDIFISSIACNLVGQTAVLGLRLQRMTRVSIKSETNDKSESPVNANRAAWTGKPSVQITTIEVDQAQKNAKPQKIRHEAHERFIECLLQYQEIKGLAQTFQDEFKRSIFGQALMSAFVICCSAYSLSGVSLVVRIVLT